jgi:hypothetical protein
MNLQTSAAQKRAICVHRGLEGGHRPTAQTRQA